MPCPASARPMRSPVWQDHPTPSQHSLDLIFQHFCARAKPADFSAGTNRALANPRPQVNRRGISAGKTDGENEEFKHGHFLLNAAMSAAMNCAVVPRTQCSA